MNKEKQNNQMYHSGMLYFDPIYREHSREPVDIPPINAVPAFTMHKNPHEPYKAVRGAKINDDCSVTLTIHEPEAREVYLAGKGYSLLEGPYMMVQNENGYFTVTLSGLHPGFYHIEFIVDGVRKLNPEMPMVFGCSTIVNFFEIPFPDEDYYILKKVPHGTLRFEHIWSDICDRYRGCWVYTPPGYDKHPDKRYPVLYIQHGGGENEAAWIWTARINYIADNYIAEGKMEEMIIVCNTGFAPKEVGEDIFVNESFEDVFIKEILPFIDSNYRTLPDRLHRAMAGLSMGGGQSRFIVHSHPDLFAWLGQFSSGAGFVVKSPDGYYGNPSDFSDLFKTPEHYNSLMKLTFISCGTEDPRHSYTSKQCQELADLGYNVEYHAYPGNHEWEPWRMSLRDFMPKLFK
ncbi:MAG: hypothetical protein GX957_01020 [Clostridiaceae bacterium]|nr:hypothetical protein [Clostridiaceae bacterium]